MDRQSTPNSADCPYRFECFAAVACPATVVCFSSKFARCNDYFRGFQRRSSFDCYRIRCFRFRLSRRRFEVSETEIEWNWNFQVTSLTVVNQPLSTIFERESWTYACHRHPDWDRQTPSTHPDILIERSLDFESKKFTESRPQLPDKLKLVMMCGLIVLCSTHSAPFFPRPLDVTTSKSDLTSTSFSALTYSSELRSPIVMKPMGAMFCTLSQTSNVKLVNWTDVFSPLPYTSSSSSSKRFRGLSVERKWSLKLP